MGVTVENLQIKLSTVLTSDSFNSTGYGDFNIYSMLRP